MECTQRLEPISDDEDQLDEDAFRRKVFGRFVVAGNGSDCEDQSFDVFGGENKIGRDPEQSNIAIDTRVTFAPRPRGQRLWNSGRTRVS